MNKILKKSSIYLLYCC